MHQPAPGECTEAGSTTRSLKKFSKNTLGKPSYGTTKVDEATGTLSAPLADGKRGWFPRGWFHDGVIG